MNIKISAILVLVTSLVISGCGPGQFLGPTVTPTPTLTRTPTLTPTSTPKPTSTRIPTATPNLIATQQYETFLPLVQNYFDREFIPSLNGTYHRLDDNSVPLAKEGYFQWSTVGMQVRNFILRSHVTMSTANKFRAGTGCGFVFRTIGDFVNAVYVQQGGNVLYSTGNTIFFNSYYSAFSNPAEFDLLFIVNEKKLRLYIDGKQALVYLTFQDTYVGDLGFTVASGSDEDQSRCEFKNNELWVIEQ